MLLDDRVEVLRYSLSEEWRLLEDQQLKRLKKRGGKGAHP